MRELYEESQGESWTQVYKCSWSTQEILTCPVRVRQRSCAVNDQLMLGHKVHLD